MANIYTDPVLKILVDKLNEEGPVALQGRYRYGDPVLVPKSALPLCFVTKEQTDIGVADTASDEHFIRVALNVVYDASRDINRPDQVVGMNELYDIVEGREVNYKLKPRSLAGVVRKYQVLDGANQLYISVGSDTEIVYGTDVRGEGVFTTEGILRVLLRQHQQRPQ